MSIIKKSLLGIDNSGVTLPNSNIVFFHEDSNLGSPYTLENVNMNYLFGSSNTFAGAATSLTKTTSSATLSVRHYHGKDIGGDNANVEISSGGGSSAVNYIVTVTAALYHYHRYSMDAPLPKKAIKLYMYTGNTDDDLPPGAIVLSDLESISGCTKMGDSTDQFLFSTQYQNVSLGTDGVGLSTLSASYSHLIEVYSPQTHDHQVDVTYGTDVNFMKSSYVDSGNLFGYHSHSVPSLTMSVDPNTIILRLFKLVNGGKIKKGMILGAKNTSSINGLNDWAVCDGSNGTPDIVNRCPVINNSKPINQTHDTSLSDFVTLGSVSTNSASPSASDHTNNHENNYSYGHQKSGSDVVNGYGGTSGYQANTSVNNEHSHSISGYSGKLGFGEIIFVKYKG